MDEVIKLTEKYIPKDVVEEPVTVVEVVEKVEEPLIPEKEEFPLYKGDRVRWNCVTGVKYITKKQARVYAPHIKALERQGVDVDEFRKFVEYIAPVKEVVKVVEKVEPYVKPEIVEIPKVEIIESIVESENEYSNIW